MSKITRGSSILRRIKKSNFLDDILWIALICISFYLLFDYLRTPPTINLAASNSNSNSNLISEPLKVAETPTDLNFTDPRLKAAAQAAKNSEEVDFKEPIEVAWEGDISWMFMSGSDYGAIKIPADKDFPDFYIYTGTEEDLYLDGKIKVYGQWTGITCAYKNTAFGHCVPIVEAKKITRPETTEEELWNTGGRLYHTKTELCEALSHKDPSADLIQEYKKNLQSPFIKHLRKSLNLFLTNNKGTCSDKDCFGNNLQAYEALQEIETDYLKSKFILLADNVAPSGGESMLILFEDKPDQVFYVWVYDYKDGTYDLRGFEKKELNVPKIQKDISDMICSGKFGI